jgi:oxygen-independent coproporphyrinogen-3 oxidase
MTGQQNAAAGLYIHVPFCSSVCPYCDFAVTIAGVRRREDYLRAVAGEAEMRSLLDLRFDTVYLGGGTPSSLAPDQLGDLLDSVTNRLAIDPGAQRYLEINPEDVTAETVESWRGLGVTTVSLGVQSFDDATLSHLGRRHSADQARRALDVLQRSGFVTVSIDLIYGIEGQEPETWRLQLEEAADRGVDHLSCYQLTYHRGTIFGRRLHRGEAVEMPGDAQAELFLLTHLVLADRGYDGYEVSNFASADHHRSLHNRKYWDHTPYLGLGPSAHSFVDRRRWWNLRKVRLWGREVSLDRLPEGGAEVLSSEDLALEMVMLGMRTAAGFDLARLRSDYGVDLMAINRDSISQMVEDGLVETDGDMLRPTLSGMAIADSLARSLEVSTRRTPGTYTERR